jgi:hypothetical protein
MVEVTERFNTVSLEKSYLPVTNKWVGSFLPAQFAFSTVKTQGVYVVPQNERTKIETHALRLGVSTTPQLMQDGQT